jgi:release factor glutamine methyltransferase
MKLKDLAHNFHSELDSIYGIDEVDSFFYLLTEHYLNFRRIQVATNPDLNLDFEQKIKFDKALEELKTQRPIQYIIGETTFNGLRILTNESVLIPRPETEELVAWVNNEIQNGSTKKLNILDIGTGSGCIAIAIANTYPNANVYAIDISANALKLAELSAKLNAVDVQFGLADILNEDDNLFPENIKFDIIVSNPPYVRIEEKEQMKANVLNNEPHIALFVEDNDPLIFYRHIVGFAEKNLSENGLLFFEINEYLGNDIRKLMEDSMFDQVELRRDIFDKERMVKINRSL